MVKRTLLLPDRFSIFLLHSNFHFPFSLVFISLFILFLLFLLFLFLCLFVFLQLKFFRNHILWGAGGVYKVSFAVFDRSIVFDMVHAHYAACNLHRQRTSASKKTESTSWRVK